MPDDNAPAARLIMSADPSRAALAADLQKFVERTRYKYPDVWAPMLFGMIVASLAPVMSDADLHGLLRRCLATTRASRSAAIAERLSNLKG